MRHYVARSSWPAHLARLLCMVALALSIGCPRMVSGAPSEQAASEHALKAAFLYQFTNYVEWPQESFAGPDSPITIAVVGADAVAAELTQVVTGRNVGGRPLSVRRVPPGEPLAGIHVLFVGRSETASLKQMLRGSPRGVLTVTESQDGLDQGSMVNFMMIDRRVRFEVALRSAEKSGIRLSSRLLAVAQHVRTVDP